jgi:hypothetical protein
MNYAVLKRTIAWLLGLMSVVGVYVSYHGIYILLAYFAAGLVWWANLALSISGPIGAVAAGLAWLRPRQKIAMVVGLSAFGAWLFLLVLMFTVFGFRPAR